MDLTCFVRLNKYWFLFYCIRENAFTCKRSLTTEWKQRQAVYFVLLIDFQNKFSCIQVLVSVIVSEIKVFEVH